MSTLARRPRPAAAYDHDFYAWTQEQAQLIRARRFSAADLANIAEEIEGLGRSERQQIKSRLRVLLLHLLKWEFQPEKRSRSWASTLLEQRDGIKDVLDESPSLAGYPKEILPDCYAAACRRAALETTLPIETFPADCPYSIEEIVDFGYLPESRGADERGR
jgi:hypothetical protein